MAEEIKELMEYFNEINKNSHFPISGLPFDESHFEAMKS